MAKYNALVGQNLTPRLLKWAFLGRVSYAEGLRLQTRLRDRIQEGREPDHLLLLEHSPVYTLGRSANRDDLLLDHRTARKLGIEVAECDRGGQVTYHGPGQLVGYPIVDLNPDRRDVRRYVRDLQTVLVRTLAEYGVDGRGGADTAEIGVWVDEAKIASIGIHLRRWITTHGFALNVSTNLEHFAGIVPCGLQSVRMTSVAAEAGEAPELGKIAGTCAREFARVFERDLESTILERTAEPWATVV